MTQIRINVDGIVKAVNEYPNAFYNTFDKQSSKKDIGAKIENCMTWLDRFDEKQEELQKAGKDIELEVLYPYTWIDKLNQKRFSWCTSEEKDGYIGKYEEGEDPEKRIFGAPVRKTEIVDRVNSLFSGLLADMLFQKEKGEEKYRDYTIAEKMIFNFGIFNEKILDDMREFIDYIISKKLIDQQENSDEKTGYLLDFIEKIKYRIITFGRSDRSLDDIVRDRAEGIAGIISSPLMQSSYIKKSPKQSREEYLNETLLTYRMVNDFLNSGIKFDNKYHFKSVENVLPQIFNVIRQGRVENKTPYFIIAPGRGKSVAYGKYKHTDPILVVRMLLGKPHILRPIDKNNWILEQILSTYAMWIIEKDMTDRGYGKSIDELYTSNETLIGAYFNTFRADRRGKKLSKVISEALEFEERRKLKSELVSKIVKWMAYMPFLPESENMLGFTEKEINFFWRHRETTPSDEIKVKLGLTGNIRYINLIATYDGSPSEYSKLSLGKQAKPVLGYLKTEAVKRILAYYMKKNEWPETADDRYEGRKFMFSDEVYDILFGRQVSKDGFEYVKKEWVLKVADALVLKDPKSYSKLARALDEYKKNLISK